MLYAFNSIQFHILCDFCPSTSIPVLRWVRCVVFEPVPQSLPLCVLYGLIIRQEVQLSDPRTGRQLTDNKTH